MALSSNLFVTDVSPSQPCNRTPTQLCRLSPSQHQISLQIPLSNLHRIKQSSVMKETVPEPAKAAILTHLSATDASLFLLYSHTPQQLCLPSPSPPHISLQIP